MRDKGGTIVEIEFRHLEGKAFAFFFTETEDDDGVVVLQHDHLDNLVNIRRC